MKIVYLLHTARKYDGSSKSFCLMLKGLIQKGVEPTIILPEYGALCDIFAHEHIPCKVTPYFLSWYPPFNKTVTRDIVMFVPRLCRMLLFNLFAESRLLRYIRAIKPDIIHSNVGPLHIGCHIAKKLHIPHVWHLREYQTLDFNMRPFPPGGYGFPKTALC